MAVRCLVVTPLWYGAVGLVAFVVSSCRRDGRPPMVTDSAAVSQPTDSLVVSREGLDVWLTLPRIAHARDGRPCLERGLEIRRGGTRIQVPLLYTGESPILLNDTTMRAVLWTHCQPLDTYLVDLRSGRPVREQRGNR